MGAAFWGGRPKIWLNSAAAPFHLWHKTRKQKIPCRVDFSRFRAPQPKRPAAPFFLSASQRENDAPRPPLAGADYARRAANIAARQFRSISKT